MVYRVLYINDFNNRSQLAQLNNITLSEIINNTGVPQSNITDDFDYCEIYLFADDSVYIL